MRDDRVVTAVEVFAALLADSASLSYVVGRTYLECPEVRRQLVRLRTTVDDLRRAMETRMAERSESLRGRLVDLIVKGDGDGRD